MATQVSCRYYSIAESIWFPCFQIGFFHLSWERLCRLLLFWKTAHVTKVNCFCCGQQRLLNDMRMRKQQWKFLSHKSLLIMLVYTINIRKCVYIAFLVFRIVYVSYLVFVTCWRTIKGRLSKYVYINLHIVYMYICKVYLNNMCI